MDELYYEDIAKIITEYKQQEKKIDNNYFTRIINTAITYKNIENYLKKVVFKKRKLQTIMGYNDLFKKLTINPQFLLLYLNSSIIDGSALEKEIINFLFFGINDILFHEIAHIKHASLFDIQPIDLETQLVQLACKFEIIRKSKFIPFKTFQLTKLRLIYEKNYFIALDERLADLESCKTSYHVANILQLDTMKNYERLRELETYIKHGSNPTIKYLEHIASRKEMNTLKEEIEKAELSFEERLKFGFEITPLEMEKLLIEKQSLERKLKIIKP